MKMKSKGNAKMTKARGGKKAKGYSKRGARMIKAMGGKMAKGYAKGSAKMMKAKNGKMAKGSAKKTGMSVAQMVKAIKKTGQYTVKKKV